MTEVSDEGGLSYNHGCVKRQFSYYGIWKQFIILKLPEGRGANRSTRRNPPDSLPANRYHILEETIQRPKREWNPHPQHW